MPDSPTSPGAAWSPQPHTRFEDAVAMVMGTLFVAIGIELFRRTGLVTGGTVGLAFLAHYDTGLELGRAYFLINIPFFAFSVRAFGWVFTAKTCAAVGLLALETATMPRLLHIDWVHPVFAAIGGGLMLGMGVLALIRHKASLGGVNVVTFFLQERRGWRAGKVQMGIDCCIVTASLLELDLQHVALSVLGAVMMNLVLALNHRPGRYVGF